ncbi:MAG: quinolinate synthase NadA [Myxococcales bacterium]|nr:quinolinate synthase NadA [Myxococcales bacterium]
MSNVDPASPGTFPSLRISAAGLQPRGSFAEAQALYLHPDRGLVERLDRQLREKAVGVVAHFYMDPELQGVLGRCGWEHIQVSDSLAMADAAIRMVEQGAETIVVLGVDFMSENVRAMLDAAGHSKVPVYRAVADPIGCSLAESAEASSYGAYLSRAAAFSRALHVVYINTSLRTKAKAHHRVPTITCTSSNVVKTVLQAASQIPDLRVFFGPDTYMGENLRELFEALSKMPAEAVAAVHPAHDPESVASLLPRFHYFEEGTCIVHHMFGAEVVARLERDYPDALITAHLEVPGEMFRLGLEASHRGRGVIGSTSNILDFIREKVQAAIDACGRSRLQFVLGTESGMITPIVRDLSAMMQAHPELDLEAEIVFPVASEAITPAPGSALGVVPGVQSGEGCSIAGGCATCPYMKMNSLDALLELLERIGRDAPATLRPLEPHTYEERIGGRTIASLGSEPILHMREFQKLGRLGDALLRDIEERSQSRPTLP